MFLYLAQSTSNDTFNNGTTVFMQQMDFIDDQKSYFLYWIGEMRSTKSH